MRKASGDVRIRQICQLRPERRIALASVIGDLEELVVVPAEQRRLQHDGE